MKNKPQVIFDNGKPAFVVLSYEDYNELIGGNADSQPEDTEFVPFFLGDYIKNPIRVARIEARLDQNQLASLLGVSQGYVSRIESRGFKVTQELLNRVKAAVSKRKIRKHAGQRRRILPVTGTRMSERICPHPKGSRSFGLASLLLLLVPVNLL